MSTASLSTTRTILSFKLLGAGLIASLVMGMWEMMVEAIIPNGAGFWSAPTYIAATLFRNLQTVARPVSFDAVAVMAGLMGHMMNSVIFGLIFVLVIAPRFKSLIAQAGAGMMYGAVVFAAMWFVALPIIDPVMLNLNAVVFFLGHLMWGVALGALNYRFGAKA
ncbi:hypothetical protein ANRL1_02929 [Anaerolineae bacterium]|nr:hypothetical protein ANRL1_02929 [Anaerolineae bacterium]